MSTYLEKLVQRDAKSFYWQNYGVLTGAYAVLIALAIGYISLSRPSSFQIIAITILLLIVPLFFLHTEYGVVALIIVRPIIDSVAGYTVFSIQGLSLNMNAVLGIAVIIWAVFVIIRDEIPVMQTPGLPHILGLGGVVIASLAVSIDLQTSLTEILRLASIPCFYIIGYHLTQRDNHFVIWVVAALGISAAVPILVSMVQLVTASGLSVDNLSNRVYGTFAHPNVLGFYMVLVLGVVGMQYISTPEKHRSLLQPWVIAGAALALTFTYTRGAWLGLIVFILIAGVLRYHKPLVLGLLSLGLLFVFGQGIQQVVWNTFNYDISQVPLVSRITGQNDESDSLNWRLGVLQDMAPYTLEQPLLGYGIGNFVTLRRQTIDNLDTALEAHNDYLRIAIETGFIGLGMYLLSLGWLAYRSFYQFALYPIGTWQKQYGLIALGLVVAFIVMSVGDNLLQATAVMWSFMFVLGALFGVKDPHKA